MSSYRGASGPWDGGPPGAEADYAGQPPPYGPGQPTGVLPTTDPWTGVSYSQYPQPSYDYQAYAAPTVPTYPYNYDYYQSGEGTYYGKYPESRSYPPATAQTGFEYQPRPSERTRSPVESRNYDRRRSYRSNSRSVSPYEKRERAYSRKRDSSYEEERQARSRSRSKSRSKKHKKYSSSSRSRSRSYTPKKKKRSSVSTDSNSPKRSYKRKSSSRASNHSLTPPLRSKSYRQSKTKRSRSRSMSKSPSGDSYRKDARARSGKEKRTRTRDERTPPKKRKEGTPAKVHKKTDRSSITPPRSYQKADRSGTPPKKSKYRDSKADAPKKVRESSVTPPKSYARSSSTSSSKSRSRSSTPRHKRKRSRSKSRRSQSSSCSNRSNSSASSKPSKTKRKKPKSSSKHRSRSRSLSVSSHGSRSRRRSKSRGKPKRSDSLRGSKSRSRSRSGQSHSNSESGSGSEDERRGQFTVADRKRFWKLHRSKQEEKDKEPRTPPKEMKPPPGAVESTHIDDIEYGDPPEVEGPNFAELLSPPDQQAQQASSSKSKPTPMPIKNDGSFLEMFKKMQEATKKVEPTDSKPVMKKPALPFIGKRRGGRVLKTGLVKKAKAIDEQTVDNTPKDAWSLYMQEVKKYRETSCEEERKTRPLVK